MGKLQKLILILYTFSIFVITFAYVPFICYFEEGIRKYNGHHLRNKLGQMFHLDGSRLRGFCEIDSSLIFVEITTITLMAAAGILFLQKKKKP